MGYVFNGIPCKTSKHERQNMITIALLVTTNTNHLLSLSTVIVDWHCGPSTRAKLAKGAMELLIVDHVYFSGQRCDVAKDTYRCRHRCLGSKHFVFESVKSKSKEALCGQHPDFKVDDHPHFVQGKRVAMCGFDYKFQDDIDGLITALVRYGNQQVGSNFIDLNGGIDWTTFDLDYCPLIDFLATQTMTQTGNVLNATTNMDEGRAIWIILLRDKILHRGDGSIHINTFCKLLLDETEYVNRELEMDVSIESVLGHLSYGCCLKRNNEQNRVYSITHKINETQRLERQDFVAFILDYAKNKYDPNCESDLLEEDKDMTHMSWMHCC
eukprot:1071429_1